jgi:hypothetical protein
LYFTVGVAPDNPPPGYFVFQNSFTFADLILALLLARAATYCSGPTRSVAYRPWAVADLRRRAAVPRRLGHQLQFQSQIYLTWSIDMALEVAVNIWCLGFGFLLAYEFAFDAYQRY